VGKREKDGVTVIFKFEKRAKTAKEFVTRGDEGEERKILDIGRRSSGQRHFFLR